MSIQFIDRRRGFPQQVELVAQRYTSGGIALELYTVPQDGDEFPFPEAWSRVTVNVPESAYLPEGAVFIKDYAENEGMAAMLKRVGVIEGEPITYAQAGFSLVEAYRLTAAALECVASADVCRVRPKKQPAMMM